MPVNSLVNVRKQKKTPNLLLLDMMNGILHLDTLLYELSTWSSNLVLVVWTGGYDDSF